MKPVIAPTDQIHHTGNDHWLFSFQDKSSSDIYVVDSMIGGSRQLSTSVEMQFLQLYGGQKLNASLLKVQQQKNLVDCGVFTVAFCTEYCYTGQSEYPPLNTLGPPATRHLKYVLMAGRWLSD